MKIYKKINNFDIIYDDSTINIDTIFILCNNNIYNDVISFCKNYKNNYLFIIIKDFNYIDDAYNYINSNDINNVNNKDIPKLINIENNTLTLNTKIALDSIYLINPENLTFNNTYSELYIIHNDSIDDESVEKILKSLDNEHVFLTDITSHIDLLNYTLNIIYNSTNISSKSKIVNIDLYKKNTKIKKNSYKDIIHKSNILPNNMPKSSVEFGYDSISGVNFPSEKYIDAASNSIQYSLKLDGDKYLGYNNMFKIKDFKCKDGTDIILINPNLINILNDIHLFFKKNIQIVSAYRTPKYNSKLKGSAENSQHLYGNAVDIQIKNIKPLEIKKFLESKNFKGGIGLYKKFIHIDVRDSIIDKVSWVKEYSRWYA